MKLTLCKICSAQMSYWKSDEYYCLHNQVLAFRHKHPRPGEPEIIFQACETREEAAEEIENFKRATEAIRAGLLAQQPKETTA